MIDPIKYRAVEQAPLIPPINKLRELSYKTISKSTTDGRQVRERYYSLLCAQLTCDSSALL